MLQGRAGPAPSTSRPCRISTQCHGAMQDPQMKLWGHAGPAFATARPRRACNQRCRAMQHLPPGLWGCAEPTASAVDPCRTHSRWHAALQDLQQCCRAVQDPQCPPCLTQDAHGRASPTNGVVGPSRLRQQQAGPVPAAAVPSCAILCHLVPPGPGSEQEPRAWGQRPPASPPSLPGKARPRGAPTAAARASSAPRAPRTQRGPQAPSSTRREGRWGPLGRPRRSQHLRAPRLAAISQHPAASAAPEPAPFTVREETATGPALAPVPAPRLRPPPGSGAAPGRTL